MPVQINSAKDMFDNPLIRKYVIDDARAILFEIEDILSNITTMKQYHESLDVLEARIMSTPFPKNIDTDDKAYVQFLKDLQKHNREGLFKMARAEFKNWSGLRISTNPQLRMDRVSLYD